ncbi:MAG: Jag N-terminal domain-containing protein [Candidatus Omnitrophica bacterium]|nr:Jag N-terminal domain-containing protein [Candidatus Omnitrophota bacterium]
MDSIEVEGRTSQEAIKIALKQLGVSRNQVRVEILSEENKGLFGMEGARPARVRVTLKKG